MDDYYIDPRRLDFEYQDPAEKGSMQDLQVIFVQNANRNKSDKHLESLREDEFLN